MSILYCFLKNFATNFVFRGRNFGLFAILILIAGATRRWRAVLWAAWPGCTCPSPGASPSSSSAMTWPPIFRQQWNYNTLFFIVHLGHPLRRLRLWPCRQYSGTCRHFNTLFYIVQKHLEAEILRLQNKSKIYLIHVSRGYGFRQYKIPYPVVKCRIFLVHEVLKPRVLVFFPRGQPRENKTQRCRAFLGNSLRGFDTFCLSSENSPPRPGVFNNIQYISNAYMSYISWYWAKICLKLPKLWTLAEFILSPLAENTTEPYLTTFIQHDHVT